MSRFRLGVKAILVRSKEERFAFKTKYEGISGLILPMGYLEQSKVYAFKRNGQLVGGFILGRGDELRTIEVFASKSNRSRLYDFYPAGNCCEVCCFWLDKASRKKPLLNALFWLQMAGAVSRQEKGFILFGTNILGLARVYSYPENSRILHRDIVNGKETYIFWAKRKDFSAGVWQIIKAKFFKHPNVFLQQSIKALSHEVSR